MSRNSKDISGIGALSVISHSGGHVDQMLDNTEEQISQVFDEDLTDALNCFVDGRLSSQVDDPYDSRSSRSIREVQLSQKKQKHSNLFASQSTKHHREHVRHLSGSQ
jgi:hypothetical protein